MRDSVIARRGALNRKNWHSGESEFLFILLVMASVLFGSVDKILQFSFRSMRFSAPFFSSERV
jgi:hypothetical protein